MYAFPFATSRYRSFHDHVRSWRGDLAVIPPNVLGQNTTTATVGGLWTATQGDVAAAMHPDAAATLRDDLFARWVRELGLPLRDEVTDLEMSRAVVNGQTACLLLESPEPIDFTSEVKVTLERGVAVPVPPRPAPGRTLDRFGLNLATQPARPDRPSAKSRREFGVVQRHRSAGCGPDRRRHGCYAADDADVRRRACPGNSGWERPQSRCRRGFRKCDRVSGGRQLSPHTCPHAGTLEYARSARHDEPTVRR